MNSTPGIWKPVVTAKALSALAVLVVMLGAAMNLAQFQSAYAQWPEGKEPTLASGFATWDVAHYLKLSQSGYQRESSSCAFYPLWPAVLKIGTGLTGGRPLLAAMLFANALSLLGFWLFYSLIRGRYGEAVARDSLILMLAFPGALFFTFPYTESLYFVLVMLLFCGLEKQRWSWVALGGFFLPLGRPVGVFVVLPLAWFLYERQKAGRAQEAPSIGAGASADGPGSPLFPRLEPRSDAGMGASTIHCSPASRGKASASPWWLLLSPLVGYASYFGLMYAWTGNALEGFEAQKSYPNSPSIKNIFNLADFTNAFLNVRSLDGMMDSIIDRGFFILVLVLLPLIYRLDRVWFWYVLPAGVVPALSSWFMSYRRYVMVLFPVFIVLAFILQGTKSRLVFWYYVVLLAALQVWAIKQFVTFNWAG